MYSVPKSAEERLPAEKRFKKVRLSHTLFSKVNPEDRSHIQSTGLRDELTSWERPTPRMIEQDRLASPLLRNVDRTGEALSQGVEKTGDALIRVGSTFTRIGHAVVDKFQDINQRVISPQPRHAKGKHTEENIEARYNPPDVANPTDKTDNTPPVDN